MSLFPWLIFTCFILNLTLVISQSEAEIRKKKAAIACFALSRARMEQDLSFKNELESNPQETHKKMMYSLVRCYTTISPTELSEILDTIQGEKAFDSKTSSNKKLLDYSNVERDIDREQIASSMKDINEVLSQLRHEREGGEESYDDDESSYRNKKTPGFSLFNVIQMFVQMNRSLIRMLALDGYAGVLMILVMSFFVLRSLNSLCSKKKTINKKRITPKENNPNEINQ